MSRIIASVGRHADLGVHEGGLVTREHRVAREQLLHGRDNVPEEAAGLEDRRRQQPDAAVDVDPFDRPQRRIADDVFRLQPIVALVRQRRCWSFAVELNLREVLELGLSTEQQAAAHELGQFDPRLRHLVAMPRDAGRRVDQQLVLRVPPAIPRSGGDPPSAGDHVGKVDIQAVVQIAFAEVAVGVDGRAGYRVRLDQVSIGLVQIIGGGWILCGRGALLRVEGAANRRTRHQDGGNPSTRGPC